MTLRQMDELTLKIRSAIGELGGNLPQESTLPATAAV